MKRLNADDVRSVIVIAVRLMIGIMSDASYNNVYHAIGKQGKENRIMDIQKETEICGLCRHHKRDGDFPDDFICCNPDSDNVGDWTQYDDSCDFWERR